MKHTNAKRAFALVLSLAMILVFVPVIAVAEDLNYKEDFEKGAGVWQLREGSSGTVETVADADRGGKVLKMSGRTANWHGASMDGSIFIANENYEMSFWVKIEGGNKAIMFTFQYLNADGGTNYSQMLQQELTPGKWTEVKGSFTVPDGTGFVPYFEMDGADGGFSIDDISITGKKAVVSEPKDIMEFYDEMIPKSLVSAGNNARILAAKAKAERGEDVTIAYIGGSITEGYNASPNNKCYASLSFEAIKTLFGGGDNIHFVNAGMAGTPSCLGIIRYAGDVLAAAPSAPDVVFIEFAVNDGDADVKETNKVAYESLIRTVLNAENDPAVVLLFSVFKSGLWNLQNDYIPVGEKYNLPMVSVKDAIAPYITEGVMVNDDFFASDGLHPTNQGHQIYSDCIKYAFEQILAKTPDTVVKSLPDPLYGNDYEGITLVDSTKTPDKATLEKGSFSEQDASTGTFQFNNKPKLPNNWKHVSGTEPFKITIEAKNLMIVYKFANSEKAGRVAVFVDGAEKIAELNSYKSDGWNNATTAVVFNDDKVTKHEVEIRPLDADKEFTILALGYTGEVTPVIKDDPSPSPAPSVSPSPETPTTTTPEPKKGGCGGGKTTSPSAVAFFGIIAAVAFVKIRFFK